MTNKHIPILNNCNLCGAPVPEGGTVAQDTGQNSSVQYPVCAHCHTPEFQAYLDELRKGRTDDAA